MLAPANVPGVMVTYEPTEEVIGNLGAIVAECGRVLVVDNGSTEEICARIAAVSGVTLLALGKNLGVAVALNRGAAWARENGCTWMITFDQDSRPEPGMAAALWAVHACHPIAAVIGSYIEEAGTKNLKYRWVRRHPRWPWLFQRVRCDGNDLVAVTFVVSSGSLIDLEMWNQLGGFDEKLFIDYIDTDFCLKIFRADRTIAVASKARLHHQLGARQSGRFFGKDFRPMHHLAFRHYYLARNRIIIWRRHALAIPHWALFDFCFALLNGFRVLIFESAKRAKFKAMLLGTWDGWKGKEGACPSDRYHALQP